MPNEQLNSTASKQAEIPSRDRWKIRIRRCLAQRNFQEANCLARQALDEFPDDPELVALEEQVIRWKQKRIQAYLWMDEGKQLCAENNFQEGLQVLRSAVSLDEHDPTLRSTLVDALLRAATVEDDLPSARVLVQEAASLDPANPAAKKVIQSLQEREEKTLSCREVSTRLPFESRPCPGPSPCVEATANPSGPKSARCNGSSVQYPAPNPSTTAKAVRNISTESELHNGEVVRREYKKAAQLAVNAGTDKRIPGPIKPDPEHGRQASERQPVGARVSNHPTTSATVREHGQRRKPAIPVWTWTVAAMVVLSICILFLWRATGRPVQLEIRKGASPTQSFILTPTPATGTLKLPDLLPGTRVRVDGVPYNLAAADGSFDATLTEGDHNVELTRPGYEPKSLSVALKAGQTVTIWGKEVTVDSRITGKQ